VEVELACKCLGNANTKVNNNAGFDTPKPVFAGINRKFKATGGNFLEINKARKLPKANRKTPK
jgi:hypothetical protein